MTAALPAAVHQALAAHVDDCCSGVRPDEAQREAYARDGWLLLRGAMRPDCVAAMGAEVLDVLRVRNRPDSFLAQAGEYLSGGYIDRWVNSPRLRAIAEDLLRGRAHPYCLFTAVKGPRQGMFGFHQDNNYTRMRGPEPFRWGINCWVALVPMRVANGALRIVPGTHLQGTVTWKDSAVNSGHREVADGPQRWIDVEMEPGDLCIFDRNTVHGSGPNGTDEPRVAYATQFHRHDSEAFFDDEWKLLSERARYPVAPVAHYSDQHQRGE